MRSSKSRLAAAFVAVLAAAGCDAADAPAHPATPAYPAAGATQCMPQETVFFSCETGKKVVSLCGTGKPGAIDAVAYRYGEPGKVELEYRATAAGGLLFHGQVEPAAPNASVHEVWFDKGDTRYLITTCEGGDCAYGAGLAVLRKGKILSKQRCVRTSPDRAFFDSGLVDFGSAADLSDSKSHTPLLRLEQDENLIEQLYPPSRDSAR